MHIKVGFVHPPNSTRPPSFEELYKTLVKRFRPSLVSAPPVRLRPIRVSCHLRHVSQTRGIGTIRSHQSGPEYEGDGLNSNEAEGQERDAEDDEDGTEPKTAKPTLSAASETAVSTPSPQSTFATSSTRGERTGILSRLEGQKSDTDELDADKDIVGIVMLEINRATDLPRLRNSEPIVPLVTLSVLIGYPSDPHGVGYGPFCGRLIQQEGLPDPRHSA
jgi:hypothetical protein